MSNPNNNNSYDPASRYFTFVVPGPPLTLNSTPGQLNNARNQLTQQIQQLGEPFPIPVGIPVDLVVVFYYYYAADNNNDDPGFMGRIDIARELTIGVLYTDNGDVAEKSIMKQTVPEGAEPSTMIRVRILEEGDIEPPPDAPLAGIIP